MTLISPARITGHCHAICSDDTPAPRADRAPHLTNCSRQIGYARSNLACTSLEADDIARNHGYSTARLPKLTRTLPALI